jgi:hypothetical protein
MITSFYVRDRELGNMRAGCGTSKPKNETKFTCNNFSPCDFCCKDINEFHLIFLLRRGVFLDEDFDEDITENKQELELKNISRKLNCAVMLPYYY